MNTCDRCGITDSLVKRFPYTDASGNNNQDYLHDTCNPVELDIQRQIDRLESMLVDIEKQFYVLKKIRRRIK